MVGKIARGILIVGAVGLAAFLIFRALRQSAEARPAAPPIPVTPPVVLNGIMEPPPPAILPRIDAGITPVPITTEPGPITTRTPAGGEVTITQRVAPEITEARLVETVLPTFEPRLATAGTGMATRQIFLL